MAALRLLVIAGWMALGLTAAAAADDSYVGYWYGQGYQPVLHEDDEFIVHRAPDGTFEIHFRTYKGCAVKEEQREGGTWAALDANTVRVRTTSINGLPAGPFVDDYRTEELTAESYRYVWVQTGMEYTSRRVDANFTFPECGLTS